MGSIWQENYRRGAKKDIVSAVDDHDLVRIEDLVDISTNASGILGNPIVGTPTEGDGLIFQGGQWVIALTNASGLNGIQIVGAPSTGEILKFDGTSWVPAVDSSGLPGTLSQVQVVNRTDVVLCNVAIPTDNTIPQITEGVEVLSRTFTANSAANRLHFRFSGYLIGAGTPPVFAVMALFRVGVSGAIYATAETLADDLAGVGTRQVSFDFFIDAPDTSAHTYTVRIGPHLITSGRTITVNDSSILGGVVATSLEVWEAQK